MFLCSILVHLDYHNKVPQTGGLEEFSIMVPGHSGNQDAVRSVLSGSCDWVSVPTLLPSGGLTILTFAGLYHSNLFSLSLAFLALCLHIQSLLIRALVLGFRACSISTDFILTTFVTISFTSKITF